MPPTTGNDTIYGGALASDIDGLAGDDLLYLRYTNQFEGSTLTRVILSLPAPFIYSQLSLSNSSERYFTILGFERFNITIFGVDAVIDLFDSDGGQHIETGSGYDDIQVGAGNNFIAAGAHADRVVIKEGLGHNKIYLGPGNDTIWGADADDTVDGGGGSDTLRVDFTGKLQGVTLNLDNIRNQWTGFEHISGIFTNYDDVITTSTFTNKASQFSGEGGRDTLILDFSASSIHLGFSWDFHVSDFEVFRITGSAFDDGVTTGTDNDFLGGGAGNDNLNGGGGYDSVYGGLGNDTVAAWNLASTIYGGLGDDDLIIELVGLSHGVNLTKANIALEWKGFEEVYGVLTNFNDTLDAGASRHDLAGAKGHDRLVLNYSNVTMAKEVFVVKFLLYGRYDTIVFTENVREDLNYYKGSIRVNGFEEYNITGTVARDFFMMGIFNDTIRGGLGADTINSGGGDDRIFGNQGADVLKAGLGFDYGAGGSGDDTFEQFGFDDTIDGQSGHDTVSLDLRGRALPLIFNLHNLGSVNWQSVEAVSGFLTRLNDRITLGAMLGETLNGGSGVDTVILDYSGLPRQVVHHITFSNEFIQAYESSTTINPNDRMQAYFPNFENFTIRFSEGNDSAALGVKYWHNRLFGLGGDDTFFGAFGHDDLFGGDGQDKLFGDRGADWLYGGYGDDFVSGGAGADHLAGGGGADTFFFEGSIQTGTDVISDYRAADVIEISGGIRREDVTITRANGDALIVWSHGSVLLEDVWERMINLSFGLD
jgi:Ca2+-binding RTX toxin-like protein